MAANIYKLALDAVSRPVLITDSTGRVAFANKAFCSLTGYDSIAGLHAAEICASRNGTLPLNEFWEGEVELRLSSGALLNALVEMRAVGAADNERAYFLLFHSLDSLSSMNGGGFAHQYKLQLLGSLAGGVVHDLNNILTSVLAHISFLRYSLPDRGPHRESLLAVEEGAKRAAATTQQILEFARGSVSKKRLVNLNFVTAGCANLLKAALPKNIVLEVLEEAGNLMLFADESQLGQIFMNLAINARDALPQGGRINVRLARVNEAAAGGSNGGTYAEMTITDNGMGIPAAMLDRIFEPFFTTKSQGGGTGLGLSNVYAIVNAYGGRISVQSTEGKGTAFRVLLPLYEGEAAAEVPPVAQIKPPAGSGRILVVEDEDIVRTVIQRSLEHLGYEVDVAQNGEEALAYYAAGKYVLVILDIMMPHMSGDAVFFKLKEMDNNVAVLIASGYSSEGRANTLLQSGARGFIQKPFGVEDLAWEVKKCLETTSSSNL